MKCVLGDIADVTMGQSPKSEFYNTEGEGMPFLQGNRTFGRRYPIFDTYTTMSTKTAKAGDVIMSVRAPVGDLNLALVDMCLGRGVCSIRMKNGNQDFLFYLLKYYMPQLINKEIGTVFGSVNRNDINGLEVEISEDAENQRRISRFLSMFDKKVEENELINENLQQMARATYLHLFFAKVPNAKLGDIIIEKDKSTIQVGEAKAMAGKYPFFTSGDSILQWSTPLVSGRNCFLNTGGNADVKFYIGEAAYSTDTWCITGTNELQDYLYLVLDCMKLELHQKYFQGTGLKHLQKDLLRSRPVYIPNDEEINSFNSRVQPWMSMISENIRETKRLSALRDWFLPMLMNGQATVAD